MTQLDPSTKGFLSSALASLDKCQEETKIFLFLTTTVQSVILALVIYNVCASSKVSSVSVMESLQHELRVSSDKDYCKQVIAQLMELELRENQRQQVVVVNVPSSIANVSSSGK